MEVVSKLHPRPVITFDDGYADNLHHALPILEKYEMKAEIFVIAGAVGLETEMWWDALERVFFHSGFHDAEGYSKAFSYLRPLSYARQQIEVGRLLCSKRLPSKARPERRMLTPEELCRLASSPLVQIGAHTLSHPVLSLLPLDAQQREITRGKHGLEDILGRPIHCFSYPNGMHCDYTLETVQAVRGAGFEYAYSAFEHHHNDRHQLPRVMVRDWDAQDFARELSLASMRAGTVLSGL